MPSYAAAKMAFFEFASSAFVWGDILKHETMLLPLGSYNTVTALTANLPNCL